MRTQHHSPEAPRKILGNASGLFVCPYKSRKKKVTLDHSVFTRWPAQYPDRLQLFSAPTPKWGEGRHHVEGDGLHIQQRRSKRIKYWKA